MDPASALCPIAAGRLIGRHRRYRDWNRPSSKRQSFREDEGRRDRANSGLFRS